MLMTVGSALLGAYLGMNSRSKIMAALVAAALCGSIHLVLEFLSKVLVPMADQPHLIAPLFSALGVGGRGMLHAMVGAAAAALISGILVSLASPGPKAGMHVPGREERAHKRKRKAGAKGAATPSGASSASLSRINQVLGD
jgi:hypothetical protein